MVHCPPPMQEHKTAGSNQAWSGCNLQLGVYRQSTGSVPSACAEPTCLIALPGVRKLGMYSEICRLLPNHSCKLMQAG